MTVTIFRDNVPIIKFQIPWKTRMTGFMLNSSPEYDVTFEQMQHLYSSLTQSPDMSIKEDSNFYSYTNSTIYPGKKKKYAATSVFDVWKGVDTTKPPKDWKQDKLYMQVHSF